MIINYNKTLNCFLTSISKQYCVIDDDIRAYYTGVPEAYLNFLSIQKNPVALKEVLNRGIDFFIKLNQSFIIDIEETLCAAYTDSIFKELGFIQGESSVSMHLALKNFNVHSTLPDNISIKCTNNHLIDWIMPGAGAFELSSEMAMAYLNVHKNALENNALFHHYTLYFDHQAVSSLTLSVCDGLARIDDVGTLPDFQKRGLGSLLMKYALTKAIEFNCTECFLCASIVGTHLYEKFGFEVISENRCYVYEINSDKD
ncbi:MAG: GNAT family N-acetyltransferase [Gammaproteobacteria bacterium]|nr:GNAT family N-acetyltransferase [Gammaproteobacteria bacterium]